MAQVKQSRKKRDRYMATLLARIESKKHYPAAARRGNVQGRIGVSFTMACNGAISNLRVNKGHALLSRAAKSAVIAAKPLPKPPKGVKCPKKIRFTMSFRLNE
ncbi:MAG TPA: hypothetical protein DDW45_03710 [Gammaproteobacteria bacterium]|nr:hypothetical protein [Gammaproteobacteria bacterium]